MVTTNATTSRLIDGVLVNINDILRSETFASFCRQRGLKIGPNQAIDCLNERFNWRQQGGKVIDAIVEMKKAYTFFPHKVAGVEISFSDVRDFGPFQHFYEKKHGKMEHEHSILVYTEARHCVQGRDPYGFFVIRELVKSKS